MLNSKIRNDIPLCRHSWWERNAWMFEGSELSVILLKNPFFESTFQVDECPTIS